MDCVLPVHVFVYLCACVLAAGVPLGVCVGVRDFARVPWRVVSSGRRCWLLPWACFRQEIQVSVFVDRIVQCDVREHAQRLVAVGGISYSAAMPCVQLPWQWRAVVRWA